VAMDTLSRGRFLEWLTQIYATAETEIACEQTQTLLARYVEAELADADLDERLADVRDHLTHCPDCHDEYAALRLAAELEACGGLPTVDEMMAQLESGVASDPLTHPVSGS
jgi:hypothetical protein